MIKQCMDELALDEVSMSAAAGAYPTAFAFGNNGKKIATKSLPGYKIAKEIDETAKAEKPSPKAANAKKPVVVKQANPEVKPRAVKKDDLHFLKKEKDKATFKRSTVDVSRIDALMAVAKKFVK